MKQLVCLKPGSFEMQDVVKPARKEGHALLKIKRIGICGTDLHAFEGTQPFFSYPRVLGHELSGEIMELDSEEGGFEVGEQVTFIPYYPCHDCVACRNGKPNCCTNIQGAGVHIDGGMVEYLNVPQYALIHGQGMSYDELAMVEPMAIGAHAVRVSEIKKDEFVIVTGAGPIGLGAMAFAKIKGAKVIALDVQDSRLEFAKEHFGADYAVNALNNPVEAVREITGGDMVTTIIDATGNLRAIEGSLDYLAHGGKITMVGLQLEKFSFAHPEFHKRETTLRSSRNATREDFDHVIDSMKTGKVDVKSLITHRSAFDNLVENFDSWLDPKTGVVKAVVNLD
ncbi:zinc-binding alcohol dehydrogenase family protein [Halosquirtibacter xylanolyticus]|uniref:zinc-binding alcohol dehydrogenase family protein n=1 Tax=Halosquirtibacter xylanolyticus TaxID=3374599 RepID=UPI00374A0EA8|nr:zinc-binding alcohol dehydrogenase family protein [Prolixibacteraceae bacterium]